MTKIIMNGCNGHMGRTITRIADENDNVEIVAGIDLNGTRLSSYPVFTDLDDCDVEADVIIDFSSADAIDHLLDYCERTHMPAVICTTGISDEQVQRITEVASETAMLRAANMSLGINTLFKLLESAANVLAPAGFDMEIVEKHHNRKVDAPSGTALALADVLKATAGVEHYYVYDRSSTREKRDKNERSEYLR